MLKSTLKERTAVRMYPYGQSAYRVSSSSADLSLKRYRFTGKERDEETGLDYFGVRYYASWLGRWISADPGGFVDELNLYRYVRNNPVNGIDREGYFTEEMEPPPKIENEQPNYIEDQDGNIVFVITDNYNKFFIQGELNGSQNMQEAYEKTYKGKIGHKETVEVMGYYGKQGYIFADNGKRIDAVLVVDNNVYKATKTYEKVKSQEYEGQADIIDDVKVNKESIIENLQANANCTGHCLADEKVVVYTGSDFSEGSKLLKNDGYKEVECEPKAGDIGVYYKDYDIVHFELYESSSTVETKGGVTTKSTGQAPKSTYKQELWDEYKVFRRENKENTVITLQVGDLSTKQGARIIDKKDKLSMKAVNKEIKDAKKRNKR